MFNRLFLFYRCFIFTRYRLQTFIFITNGSFAVNRSRHVFAAVTTGLFLPNKCDAPCTVTYSTDMFHILYDIR